MCVGCVPSVQGVRAYVFLLVKCMLDVLCALSIQSVKCVFVHLIVLGVPMCVVNCALFSQTFVGF